MSTNSQDLGSPISGGAVQWTIRFGPGGSMLTPV
jgi:hypothetical protein